MSLEDLNSPEQRLATKLLSIRLSSQAYSQGLVWISLVTYHDYPSSLSGNPPQTKHFILTLKNQPRTVLKLRNAAQSLVQYQPYSLLKLLRQ